MLASELGAIHMPLIDGTNRGGIPFVNQCMVSYRKKVTDNKNFSPLNNLFRGVEK